MLVRSKIFQWSRLDNAAKIFPPTSSAEESKVFRFACELVDPVQPEPLQQALDETLEQFSFYRCALKKGFFWYYLENRDLRVQVEPESDPPCAPLYRGDGGDPLFRVSYYRNRINLEVYHALADGTGAMRFLQFLVRRYLLLLHPEIQAEELPPDPFAASRSQQFDDSFARYYTPGGKLLPSNAKAAYHLRGAKLPDYRLSIVEGLFSAKDALELAHKYDVSLTVFLTAILMRAIHSRMSLREQRRPVTVSVPVNLRNYFPSDTARNFFGVINLSYDFSARSGELEDIIEQLRAGLEQELTAERLAQRMNQLARLEHMMLLRLIPLFLKVPVLRLFNFLAERQVTASLSNLGRIAMPSALAEYLRRFDVFFSTRRMQVCLSSFEDHLVVTFTSPFVSPDVQRSFFCQLTQMGLPITLTTNLAEFGTEER